VAKSGNIAFDVPTTRRYKVKLSGGYWSRDFALVPLNPDKNAPTPRLKRTRTYVTKCELGERRIDMLEWLQFCRACETDPVAALTKIRKAIRT